MANLMLKELPQYDCLLALSKHYPDLNPVANEAVLHLLRASDELHRLGSNFFAKYNLSHGRFTVLMFLALDVSGQQPPRTPAEMAEWAGCTRATMTGLIDTLERDGMVRREPDAHDRRMLRIALTEKGNTFIQGMIPEHFRRINALMSNLSSDECKQLTFLLDKVMKRARELDPYSNTPGAENSACGVTLSNKID
jgi:DNA-binding MarR family transcriptional regulator